MAVAVLTAHWWQWQGWMIAIMLGVLLATAAVAGNFNHDGDYNGDGIMDPAVYDEPTGEWHVLLSGSDYTPQSCVWGGPGLTAIQSDYDGDGRADLMLYNRTTGTWCVRFSRSGFLVPVYLEGFGGPGWTPVVGDYDNDGIADPAIYGEATGEWWIKLSRLGYAATPLMFGGPGYTAVSGDYDGDGCSDPAIYRRSDGLWAVRFSSLGYTTNTVYVDTKGDGPLVPSPADYDGDRITDPAVFAYSAPSFMGKRYVFAWHLLYSSLNYQQIDSFYQLGREDAKPSNADPAPGDYDGDGKADFGVSWPDFESANVMWRMWKSSNHYGGHDDIRQWSGTDVHPVQR
ncbi:MAG: VCBS repeat-containing protein [Kiritimatiellaeota bacterium]|nr:VCBS repeat-containing protein [Kiritimatiellota bacterium]